jgi:hypothetical protein
MNNEEAIKKLKSVLLVVSMTVYGKCDPRELDEETVKRIKEVLTYLDQLK